MKYENIVKARLTIGRKQAEELNRAWLEKLKSSPELTDREVYSTPIGPVCMSKAEHEAYLEELEWRKMKAQP